MKNKLKSLKVTQSKDDNDGWMHGCMDDGVGVCDVVCDAVCDAVCDNVCNVMW